MWQLSGLVHYGRSLLDWGKAYHTQVFNNTKIMRFTHVFNFEIMSYTHYFSVIAHM